MVSACLYSSVTGYRYSWSRKHLNFCCYSTLAKAPKQIALLIQRSCSSRMSFLPAEPAKVLDVKSLEDKDAKWTRLVSIKYRDPSGKERFWESAERRNRPESSDVDSVGIVALLKQPSGPAHILLQKQFRPPINKICIEVPAGLVDEGETPQEAAVRELKEETGYVGKVSEISPIMFNDPGFTNTNTRMIHVDVEMADERNQKANLKPELEENEYIECFTCPLDQLWDECKRLELEGYAIDARVCTLAEGIEVAKNWL